MTEPEEHTGGRVISSLHQAAQHCVAAAIGTLCDELHDYRGPDPIPHRLLSYFNRLTTAEAVERAWESMRREFIEGILAFVRQPFAQKFNTTVSASTLATLKLDFDILLLLVRLDECFTNAYQNAVDTNYNPFERCVSVGHVYTRMLEICGIRQGSKGRGLALNREIYDTLQAASGPPTQPPISPAQPEG